MSLLASCNMITALALGLVFALIASHVGKSHGLGVDVSLGNGGKSSLGLSTSRRVPSGLQVGFYKGKCSNKTVDVESLIATKVKEHFNNDSSILPAILRMQFNDCFVRGCDASILLDGSSTEKTAFPNQSVRGFDVIDSLKDSVESECPDIVSCADIIAIATKVLIKLGGGPDYPVQTGRRDGRTSLAREVNRRIPSPFMTVPQCISAFEFESFKVYEMVALFGGHSVGITHCRFFQPRLYNGTKEFDPKMDPGLRKQLMLTCPKGTMTNNVTFLDQNPQSSNKFDNSFFDQIKRNRGILPIDQALARHPKTSDFVQKLASNPNLFNTNFTNAMIRLQAHRVLKGKNGEIRKVCSKVNPGLQFKF